MAKQLSSTFSEASHVSFPTELGMGAKMTRTRITYAATFLSGLLLGWLAIGWWLWPVEYVDEITYQRIATQNQASEVSLDWLIPLTVIVVVLAVGVGVAWLAIRRKQVSAPPAVASLDRVFVTRKTEEYIPINPTLTRTLAHAQLTFGPTQSTDQHFPIESQQEGEPSPGEFGVNQVDDQPAWDVWLFDKQALVTVTKVLAERADEELASRGELIEWKRPFTLETANLTLTGRAYKELEGNLRVDLTVEAKDAE